LLVIVLFVRDLRAVLGATAAIVVIWAGLYFSYSQSSFAALAAGVVIAAIFAWGRRGIALAVATALVVAAAALAVPSVRHDVLAERTGKSATSGRGTLVRRGAHIAVHHPVAGVGLGGFKHAYANLAGLKGKEPNAAASHTTPVTVAAEGGIVGFALFVWLLVAALALAFRRFARAPAGRAGVVCGWAVAAMGLHRPFSTAFSEDATVWSAIGLAPALPRRQDERPDAPQLDREVEPEREQGERVDGAEQDGAGERD